MLRILLIIALIAFGTVLLWKLIEYVRTRKWDWTGIAFAVGFVVLAFWLRSVTGIGGWG
jgi:hypothetical protein